MPLAPHLILRKLVKQTKSMVIVNRKRCRLYDIRGEKKLPLHSVIENKIIKIIQILQNFFSFFPNNGYTL